MSYWDLQFNDHAVHDRLDRLCLRLDDLLSKTDTSQDAIEHLERLKQVSNTAKKALSQVEPVLASQNVLNNYDSYFENQLAQLDNYETSNNVAHLLKANTYAEGVLLHLPSLRTIASPSEVEGVKDAVSSFRMSTAQYMRYVESEYSALKTKYETLNERFSDLSSEIASQKSRLDTAISEFQKQFSSSESQRSDRFNKAEQLRQTQHASQLKEHTDSLNEIRLELEKTVADLEPKRVQVLDSFIRSEGTRHEKFRLDQEKKAVELIGMLSGLQSQAEDLVGVIANTGMTGGYQKVANEERKSAVRFQTVAILAMLGLIGFAVAAFFTVVTDGFDVGLFATKAFAAISFGVLAGYAARQAERHHQIERHNRKMELELTAIGPYLASLPEETQFGVKQVLAEKIFGKEPQVPASKKNDRAGTSTEAFDLAMEAIKALAGK